MKVYIDDFGYKIKNRKRKNKKFKKFEKERKYAR